jgi:hypothetical protein
MRLPVLSLSLIAVALLGEMPVAPAQSPTSYPWCSRAFKMDTSATSCYFTSREQCMATLSGIGGYCIQSPYFHAAVAGASARSRGRRLTSR